AQQQVERQKQAIIRKILTPEARQRLTNIRMVKPEFAAELEMQLIQLAQAGRLQSQVTDEQRKKTLVQLQGQKKEIKIRRAKPWRVTNLQERRNTCHTLSARPN